MVPPKRNPHEGAVRIRATSQVLGPNPSSELKTPMIFEASTHPAPKARSYMKTAVSVCHDLPRRLCWVQEAAASCGFHRFVVRA